MAITDELKYLDLQEHELDPTNIDHRKAMREHGLNQIKNNSHCVQHNAGSKLSLIRKAISELKIRKERREIKKVCTWFGK
tara:strand:+ start:1104 stop:1343 length:240 start_codon:yes stop_codon:yes gene_type:complete